ncbi:PKD domain-containing protein [Enterovibrio norvegicus]|uniref:PKD domain-containing protein n=2 Tax=Enterovibrio norvegicus TaxID=188144 RepID=UPI000C816503|nr:hypothetical protein [Enterovibrio norvegicus]PMH65832.1 hypothetical protein BCU62_00740 [Enterovibrio norvegicus]
MLKTKPSILALALTSILLGCGGSEDESSNSTPVVDTPETGEAGTGTPQVQKASLQIVSGKLTTPDYTGISDAQVSISILNKSEESLYQQTATTDSNGLFEAMLPQFENADTAASIIVSFDKSGFTSGEKLFSVDSDSVAVNADAVISPVVVKSFKKQDLEIVASNSEKRTVTFSLVSDVSGRKAIQAGTPLAMSATESNLKIDLPIDAIGEDVEALNVEMAHFDSSNTTDIQAFPGDFVGYGETENQGVGTNFGVDNADEDPYRLVSTTFAQISITDQNGDLLPISESLSASGETPTVQAFVSPSAYKTITEDVASDINGIQVPIYVYRSSKWEFVGNGSLTNAAGDFIEANHTPGALPEYLEGLSHSVYVSIPVTSANQWVKWINLDWPMFAEPTQTCVTGELSYERGAAHSGNVILTLPDGGTEWAYADYEGLVSNTFQAIEGAASGYQVHVYNPLTNESEVYQPSVVSGGECDVNIDVTYELINPYQCSISGTLFEPDGETTIPNTWVQSNLVGTRFSTVSDEQGQFSLSSNCEGTAELRAFGQNVTITLPDGLQPGDAHTNVALIRQNQAPSISVWQSNKRDYRVSDGASFYHWVYDQDGDEYTYEITCSEGCSFTESGRYVKVSFANEGIHTVSITATDEYGDSATKDVVYDVKADGNIAPEILGFDINGQRYSPNGSITVVEGENITLDVIAIDKQGDAISYTWENNPQGNCEAATCNYASPSASTGNIAINVTATDDNAEPKSSDSEFTILVEENQAPEVLLSSTANTLWTASQVTLSDWRVRAVVKDDQNAVPNFSWSFIDSAGEESNAFTTDDKKATLAEGDAVQAGEYIIRATASDNLGAVTIEETRLLVHEDSAPTLDLVASTLSLQITDKGEGIEDILFEATFEDDRTPLESLDVDWTFPAGISLEIAEDNQQATWLANNLVEGITDITVSVTDAFGQTTTQTLSVDIQIAEDLAPDVTLNASHTVVDIIDAEQDAHDVIFTAQIDDDFTDIENLTIEWTTDNGVSLVVSEDKTRATMLKGALVDGDTVVSVMVTDAFGQVTTKYQTLTVNIIENAAPEVSLVASHNRVDMIENGQGAQDVTFTVTYSDDLTASEDLEVTWTATNGINLQISQDGKTATLLAADLYAGETLITVSVSDENGAESSDTQQLIVVMEDDTSPEASLSASHTEIEIPASGEGSEDVTFTLTVSDDYTPTEDLHIAWYTSTGANLRVSDDGKTAVLPGSALQGGIVTVSASVTDEESQTTTALYDLSVNIANDEWPLVNLEADHQYVEIYEDGTGANDVVFTATFSDDNTNNEDLDVFWTSSSPSPFILSQDNTQATIKADSLVEGETTMTIEVFDSAGQSTAISLTINVVLINDEHPEVQLNASHSDIIVGENGLNATDVTFSAVVSDDRTDAQQLEIEWQATNGAFVEVGSDGRTAKIDAQELSVGETQITVTVTDEMGQSSVATHTLTISVDQQPDIQLTASHDAVTVGESGQNKTDVIFTASVSDDLTDAQQLVIEWDANNGVFIDVEADGRTARIAANELTQGQTVVTATVTDERGQSSTATRTLVVSVDQRPEITSLTVSASTQLVPVGEKNNQPVLITVLANDDRTSDLPITWETDTGLQLEPLGNTLLIQEGLLGAGSYQATATVTDELGQTASQSVSFSITEQSGNIGVEIE